MKESGRVGSFTLATALKTNGDVKLSHCKARGNTLKGDTFPKQQESATSAEVASGLDEEFVDHRGCAPHQHHCPPQLGSLSGIFPASSQSLRATVEPLLYMGH